MEQNSSFDDTIVGPEPSVDRSLLTNDANESSLDDGWTYVSRDEKSAHFDCINDLPTPDYASNQETELIEIDTKNTTSSNDTGVKCQPRVSLKGGISNLSFQYTGTNASLESHSTPASELNDNDLKECGTLGSIHSCLDELSDAVLEINPSRIRTYVHRRNEKLDVWLSSILPFIFIAAISLGIGSYIGSYQTRNGEPYLLTNRELRLMSLLQNKIISCLRDQIIHDNGIYRTVCTSQLDQLSREFDHTFKLSPELKQKLLFLQKFDTLSPTGNYNKLDPSKLCPNGDNTGSSLCELYSQSNHNLNQLISLHHRWHLLLSQFRLIQVYKMFRSTPILSIGIENGTHQFQNIYDDYLKSKLTSSELSVLVNGLLLENKLLWLLDPESPSVCHNSDDSTCGMREDLSIKSEIYYVENTLLWQSIKDVAMKLGVNVDHHPGHHRADLASIKKSISKMHTDITEKIDLLKAVDISHAVRSQPEETPVDGDCQRDNFIIQDLHLSNEHNSKEEHKNARKSPEESTSEDENIFEFHIDKLKEIFTSSNNVFSGKDVNQFLSNVADYSRRGVQYSVDTVGQIADVVGDQVVDLGSRIGNHVKKTTSKAKRKIQSGDLQNYLADKLDNLQTLGKHYVSLGQKTTPKIADALSENFKQAVSSVKDFVSNIKQGYEGDKEKGKSTGEKNWLKSFASFAWNDVLV